MSPGKRDALLRASEHLQAAANALRYAGAHDLADTTHETGVETAARLADELRTPQAAERLS